MRRDVEKIYSRREFVAKLRRLAAALEKNQRFVLQVAGKRVPIPRNAQISVEHECEGGKEEVEFQLTWSTTQSRSAAPRAKAKIKARTPSRKASTKKSTVKKARALRRR